MQRGIGSVIAGIVLFVAGVAIIPALIIFTLVRDDSGAKQFLVPGSLEVTVTKSGRYYLWNDFRTLFHGKTYNAPEDLPGGLSITIFDSKGQAMEFINDGSTSSHGSTSKRSIGYVEVPGPGALTVEVSGTTEPRVFSFARSRLAEIFAWIIGGMGGSVLVAIAGIAVGILGVIRLVSAKSQGSGS